MGKNYDFNTADTLNTLLLNCMFASGQLKEGKMYDVDFDHQFIETEKYDAKPTYKKFLGYRPGVAVIGDLIVGIENCMCVPYMNFFFFKIISLLSPRKTAI